jgi:hypothetical protein
MGCENLDGALLIAPGSASECCAAVLLQILAGTLALVGPWLLMCGGFASGAKLNRGMYWRVPSGPSPVVECAGC